MDKKYQMKNEQNQNDENGVNDWIFEFVQKFVASRPSNKPINPSTINQNNDGADREKDESSKSSLFPLKNQFYALQASNEPHANDPMASLKVEVAHLGIESDTEESAQFSQEDARDLDSPEIEYNISIWENEKNSQQSIQNHAPEIPRKDQDGYLLECNLNIFLEKLERFSDPQINQNEGEEMGPILRAFSTEVKRRVYLEKSEVLDDQPIAIEFLELRLGQLLDGNDDHAVTLYTLMSNKIKIELDTVLLSLILHLEFKFRQLNAVEFATFEAEMKAELGL
ncbi:DUF1716 domain-containing protein [Caenorhabditis elegans]|uniref:DUF1716 domain-containing protein n=1 Tax=Caenorhabditis elegans TaxID=6239 RepID=Q22732_CAEEL|nr:DUF1716 domain-containing protein [Caenorhabditis elegans]CAA92016.2 DUF1716 domain-containing protein [Caenorhabditis elegans]